MENDKNKYHEVSFERIKGIVFKNKKRKFLSMVLIVFVMYSMTWQIYNYEPTTSHVRMFDADVAIYNTDEAFNGYNLFMFMSADIDPLSFVLGGARPAAVMTKRNTHLVIMDMDGNIVISRPLEGPSTRPGSADLLGLVSPVEVINETTISVMDGDGIYLWNLKTNVEHRIELYGHHEVEYNPTNNTIFTYGNDWFWNDGIEYFGDVILEYDMDSNIVWSLNMSEYLDIEWRCPNMNEAPPQPMDFTHSNAIYYDVEEDLLICNVRNLDGVVAFDHKTKDVVWHVGRHGDYTLYDINGNEVPKLFSHSHDTKEVEEDVYITFDNNHHNLEMDFFTGLPLGQTVNQLLVRARIVEFKVDHDTKTANETWVWEAPASMIQPMWGGASRLPNGNRLGTFGAPSTLRGFGLITDKGPQIVEINDEGEIVWKATFRVDSGWLSGMYRCLRLPYDTWKFIEGE